MRKILLVCCVLIACFASAPNASAGYFEPANQTTLVKIREWFAGFLKKQSQPNPYVKDGSYTNAYFRTRKK